jgi:hypothetical protein
MFDFGFIKFMRYIHHSILLLICLTVSFASFVAAQVKQSNDLLLIRVNGKAGFIDRSGKIIIEPQFDYAGQFSEGIAPVLMNKKWGFIDEFGKVVIEPQFDEVYWHRFSDGLIPVKLGDKMGAIDKSGNFVIEPKFETVLDFSEGVAPVQIGRFDKYSEKWIFVDRQGKQAIDKEFFGARKFVKGRAFVKVGFDEWALIDKNGNEVTKKHFSSFDEYNMFSEGLVAVRTKKKYGFIDRNGNFVIKPRFNDASNFSEGLAAVEVGCVSGYINTKGKIIIKPKFNIVGNFSDGLAGVEPISKDFECSVASFHDNMGYIDKTGKMVIPPNFGRSFDFSNGIAQVSFGEPWDVIGAVGKRGYIDKTGKYIWKPTE